MHRIQRAALVLICALPSLSIPLQAPRAQTSGQGDPLQAEEATASTQVTEIAGRPLSLDEAIALGLQNNLGVEVSRYTPYVSEMDAEAAWGAYDPVFAGQVQYHELVAPATNAFVPSNFSEASTTDGSAGLQALIPYLGAGIGVAFSGAKDLTNSGVASLSPEYSSGITFSANVPLMRNLIWNGPWTQVKTSRLAYGSSLDDFETAVMDIVQGIITDYWNLVATREQQRVAEKSLERSRALLDQTQTQYQVGVVSRVEVVQAEAGVASSEFDLIVASNAHRNAQDQLIASVLGRQLQAGTTLLFDPVDNPVYQAVGAVDVERAVATAFEKRPELSALEKQIEQGTIQVRFAKNQRLPQLDASLSYTTLGISGSENPDRINFNAPNPPTPPPPAVVGGFGKSTDFYFAEPRDFTVKGVFTIPIPNTAGRKNVRKAEFQLRQAESSRTRLRQTIIVSVRQAARGLLASAQGVEAAERRRLAAAEQLRAERIRLEHGESTPFDVLQRERDLVEAESQKIAALRAFRDSQAALERAQGTILERRNVVIDQVRALR